MISCMKGMTQPLINLQSISSSRLLFRLRPAACMAHREFLLLLENHFFAACETCVPTLHSKGPLKVLSESQMKVKVQSNAI